MITHSIVIPVYRSSQCLPELVKRLERALEEVTPDYEVIFVDDCSPDDCWQVLEELLPTRPRFRAVQLMKNCGQTKATMCGIRLAQGKIVITMDDDLQHDPALIPQLLQELDSDGGQDCVFAYFPEKKHSAYRNAASKVIGWINSQAFGNKRQLKFSSFRLMRDYIAEIIRQDQTSTATVGGVVLANASRIKSVPITHHERLHGKSNYNFATQLRLAFDNICSVSMLPLRLISIAGLCAAGFSGLLTCYFLFRFLFGTVSVAGWTTVVILISFFSGLILLSLGVIGEYMVRVLRELQTTVSIPIRKYIGATKIATPGTQPESIASHQTFPDSIELTAGGR